MGLAPLVRLTILGAAFTVLGLPAYAQDYQPPMTEHGQPDLRGVWNFSSRTPLERPERFGEIEFLRDVDAATLNARPAVPLPQVAIRPPALPVLSVPTMAIGMTGRRCRKTAAPR